MRCGRRKISTSSVRFSFSLTKKMSRSMLYLPERFLESVQAFSQDFFARKKRRQPV